jgi:hypothetical protein
LEFGLGVPAGIGQHSSPIGAVFKMTWEVGGDEDRDQRILDECQIADAELGILDVLPAIRKLHEGVSLTAMSCQSPASPTVIRNYAVLDRVEHSGFDGQGITLSKQHFGSR